MAESIQENDHIFTIGQDRIRYIVSSREVSRVTSTAPDATLQKDEQPGPAHDNPPSVTSLSLIITGLCNLRCPYCYTRGLADNYEGEIMSEESGRQAIDLLLRTASTPSCQILFIGGEPMLHWDLIRNLVEYGEEQASRQKKHIGWKISTNGTHIPSESPQFLKEHGMELLIDIDGPPEIHDRNRPFADGSGSYGIISSNYWSLREAGVSPVFLRATATPSFPRVSDLYTTLLDFRPDGIRVIPQFFDFGLSGWKEDTLALLLQGYSDLAEDMLTRIIDGTYRGIMLDPFTPFIYLLCTREKKRLYCGGAGSIIAVTPQGRIYPCCALIRDDSCLGNIRDGIDFTRLAGWSEACDIEQRSSCTSCWARYLCGGGCYANAIAVNGSLDRPVETECRIMKQVIELSIWLYLRLLDEKPEFFLNLVSWKPEIEHSQKKQ